MCDIELLLTEWERVNRIAFTILPSGNDARAEWLQPLDLVLAEIKVLHPRLVKCVWHWHPRLLTSEIAARNITSESWGFQSENYGPDLMQVHACIFMLEWYNCPKSSQEDEIKCIIMCFICDIIARIRDLLLSWLDPCGNSIISFLLVSDRLSVMTNCLGLAKLTVRPSVLFPPRTSPKSFQCEFPLGKLCKLRHRSNFSGVPFPVPFAVIFSLADCGWNKVTCCSHGAPG